MTAAGREHWKTSVKGLCATTHEDTPSLGIKQVIIFQTIFKTLQAPLF